MRDRQWAALRCSRSQISKKLFIVVAWSPGRKVHACRSGRSADIDCAFEGQVEGASTRSSSTPSRSTPGHPLFSMQKKRKKSRNRTYILRLFKIVSQWTLNLQGAVPACVRQTTLFEQVEMKNEDYTGSRYLRLITSIWWAPLWVVKDNLWSKSGHLPYISPIVDHTFVWGRGEGVKCHVKVLSFVRDVRTFEMTP